MATALSIGAAAFGLTWLVLILLVLVVKGVGGLTLAVFTEMTPPPGGAGGLLNPIVGSPIVKFIGHVGTPLGILAGTYMAEYGRYAKLTMVVRLINDILLSAPSIVVGLFVYEIMVATHGAFLRLGGCRRPRHDCHSRGGENHGGHAAARAQYSARGGRLRSACRNGW